MNPNKHIIASSLIGLNISLIIESASVGILCFLSGILPDIDHILEYTIHHGYRKLSYKNVVLACQQTKTQEGEYQFKKLYLILHSIEACIFLWYLLWYTKSIHLFGIALGYTTHLVLDQYGNQLNWHSYFIISRLIHGFNTEKLKK